MLHILHMYIYVHSLMLFIYVRDPPGSFQVKVHPLHLFPKTIGKHICQGETESNRN